MQLETVSLGNLLCSVARCKKPALFTKFGHKYDELRSENNRLGADTSQWQTETIPVKRFARSKQQSYNKNDGAFPCNKIRLPTILCFPLCLHSIDFIFCVDIFYYYLVSMEAD